MKMTKSQAGFSPVHALLVLVVLGAIGFAGWKVYEANKAKSVKSNSPVQPANTNTEPPTVQSTVPEGFTKYENKSLGLKFAYPTDWGEVKDDSNSAVVFSAHFTNLKKGNEDLVTGKNVNLFANTGKQDFSVGGRGGALWDCIGYTKAGSTYFCQGIAKRQEGVTNRGTEIKNPQVIKAVNNDVIAYTYNYFGDEVFNITTNLYKDYYAFVLVTNDSNQELKSQLKQVAATVEVL